MRIVKGDGGDILFRDDTKGNGYYFFIDQNGIYRFGTYNNCPDNCTLSPLRDTSDSTDIKTGLNQSNLVAVVAHGSTIALYVNHIVFDSVDVSGSNYSQGHIGVFAL